jgi:uncharacterized membrane protein
MSKKRNHDVPLSEDMEGWEAIAFLFGGFYWLFRTVFWGFMVVTFAPILGSIVPAHVAQNILAGCLANGFRLLEEAHDKGYITEECYDENKHNLG